MEREPSTGMSISPAQPRPQPRNSMSLENRTHSGTGQSNSQSIPHKSAGRSRGGRQGKKRDLGRSAWAKQKIDKRQRNDDEQEVKRRRVDRGEAALPIYATKFSDDVLAAEERRPKKKVAVLIGYSGTGYKGMQLTHDQKTIEGDLFQAFVAAGAISKANADDPKKSSFVRCARTDKGVHAAGNVISLKLIVEDEDIVKRINDNLNPQIRVWGFERTNNSFSAYQLCDSRIYEYLIPSYSYLPPHPSSHLGRKCKELAEQKDDLDGWKSRQEEVEGFWKQVEEELIKPILESYDEETRSILEKALYLKAEEGVAEPDITNGSEPIATKSTLPSQSIDSKPNPSVTEATKRLRAAYTAAKRAWRIPSSRLARLRAALALYEGTRNYHNYTVAKTYRDPSSKRVIKSFVLNPNPILINGTEWLSLKVHGQSFMMHQIRKMVGMAALTVRCGADPSIIVSSYGPENISIPKAPSLGLLLQRPVFDSYNKRAKSDLGKEAIDFEKFQTEMDSFKQSQIYERMYEDEEKDNVFGNFFNHVDNFPASTFLFVTSGGIEATKSNPSSSALSASKDLSSTNKKALDEIDLDSDADDVVNDANGEEG